jgi:restriction endonuclease S subunit
LSTHKKVRTYPAAKVKKLREIANISQGVQISRYQDLYGDNSHSYQIVSPSNVDKFTLNGEADSKTLSNKDMEKYQIYSGDIVVVIRFNIGKAAIVPESFNGSLADQYLSIVRILKPQDVLPRYLVVLFNSEWFKQQLASIANLSTVKLISISQLRKLEIPLPSLELQHKISDLFFTLEEVKQSSLDALQIRQQIAEEKLFQLFEGTI